MQLTDKRGVVMQGFGQGEPDAVRLEKYLQHLFSFIPLFRLLKVNDLRTPYDEDLTNT